MLPRLYSEAGLTLAIAGGPAPKPVPVSTEISLNGTAPLAGTCPCPVGSTEELFLYPSVTASLSPASSASVSSRPSGAWFSLPTAATLSSAIGLASRPGDVEMGTEVAAWPSPSCYHVGGAGITNGSGWIHNANDSSIVDMTIRQGTCRIHRCGKITHKPKVNRIRFVCAVVS